jgi:hypothetical protein
VGSAHVAIIGRTPHALLPHVRTTQPCMRVTRRGKLFRARISSTQNAVRFRECVHTGTRFLSVSNLASMSPARCTRISIARESAATRISRTNPVQMLLTQQPRRPFRPQVQLQPPQPLTRTGHPPCTRITRSRIHGDAAPARTTSPTPWPACMVAWSTQILPPPWMAASRCAQETHLSCVHGSRLQWIWTGFTGANFLAPSPRPHCFFTVNSRRGTMPTPEQI